MQDNKIRKVENVGRLSQLHTLNLAANPIESFEAVSEVAGLPSLQGLTFNCEHFGPCPVAEVPGFRAYVLSSIAQ